jgi:predicted AAA+ superfamily ATPase
MPAAVLAFATNRDLHEVRQVQAVILDDFYRDFSKHIASASIPKLALLWDSIPAQLAKEKKRFIYKEMKSGARSRAYEDALLWLEKCGLVYKINQVSLPNLPLAAYQQPDRFKLYALDVGLLSAKAGLDIAAFTSPNHEIFNHFKGALIEQYVLQELKTLDERLPVYYWTNERNTSEVDFVIQKWNEIIPVEVKASVNLKAKSLKAFMDAWNPARALRTSLAPYARHDRLYDIPLYLIGVFPELIKGDILSP